MGWNENSFKPKTYRTVSFYLSIWTSAQLFLSRAPVGKLMIMSTQELTRLVPEVPEIIVQVNGISIIILRFLTKSTCLLLYFSTNLNMAQLCCYCLNSAINPQYCKNIFALLLFNFFLHHCLKKKEFTIVVKNIRKP